jgi:hypothetical protein
MHFGTNLKRFKPALEGATSIKELLTLAVEQTQDPRLLDQRRWGLVSGKPSEHHNARVALMRQAHTVFDHEVYLAKASTLGFADEVIAEELLKPFFKKITVPRVWFTVGWENYYLSQRTHEHFALTGKVEMLGPDFRVLAA